MHSVFTQPQEYPPLAGRDHMAFRSAYWPVKDVVDGDLCSQFPTVGGQSSPCVALYEGGLGGWICYAAPEEATLHPHLTGLIWYCPPFVCVCVCVCAWSGPCIQAEDDCRGAGPQHGGGAQEIGGCTQQDLVIDKQYMLSVL
jgi:hypothetical protein